MRRFPRTFHALEGERPGVSLVGLLLVTALLVGWLVWLFAARISVFEVTPLGRLEVDRAAYPITSQVDGRVVEVPMDMGVRVEQGDLLVQLDTRELEIRLREAEARLASIVAELEAARRQLELRRESLPQKQRVSQLRLEGEEALQREAEIQATSARDDAERTRALFDNGLISEAEAERAAAEAERLAEAAESHRLTVDREKAELRTLSLADQTDIAELSRTVAGLEGEAETVKVTTEQVRLEIDQRSLRAPYDGVIGDVTDLPVMTMVREGDRLGTLLASGDIKVVADFAAASALGRVRLGHEARVRLDGFPWTQFGMLSATVDRVATEPRAGRLRVELEVDAGGLTRVPLQHGLTGTVEVEVERITPAVLLLRTLGKVLRPAAAAPEETPPRTS